MFSNRPARPKHGPLARPWSLRRRLIVQLAGLLALVCLIVGVITELALRDFLIGQLDDRLVAANERGNRSPLTELPRRGPNQQVPPDSLRVPGQTIGTLGVRVEPNGTVLAGVLKPVSDATVGFPYDPVPQRQLALLKALPADGVKRTQDLGPLGQYRVVASRSPNGALVIVGLPMRDVFDTLWRLGFIFGGVALGGVLFAGIIGAITIRRTLHPLDRLAATASRVAELPLDRGEVALSVRVSDVDTDSRTEVGKVGAALNRMLGHVSQALIARQASESRVRQFVADASHELRTPLSAIRGYSELTRRNLEQVPPDVAFAMSRVESESARMTTLVEELLLLARLDSGRQVVRQPVDLSRIVADAVADAHVAGTQHRWLLEVPANPIVILGDAGQIHQVVINLLNNARTHTPAGTTVNTVLSVSSEEKLPATVRLVVSDNGPGIPAEVLPEVFERFARGDNSRSRAAGSTGLGLAIVAAVVAAHQGEVSVRSEPGRTEFAVVFPLQEG